jgi:hypothetical protein
MAKGTSARGAAYYGKARLGRGIRIRGGVPRTYYIGIETAMPAVPGLLSAWKRARAPKSPAANSPSS